MKEVYKLFNKFLESKKINEEKLLNFKLSSIKSFQNRLDARYHLEQKACGDLIEKSLIPTKKLGEFLHSPMYTAQRGKRVYVKKGIQFLSTTDISKINVLGIKKYLSKKMKIDEQNASRIADELEVGLNDKFERIGFINRKALIIKAHFEKSNSIIIDYYGVSAIGIKKLERIVNSEIEKGKTGIAFDLLEYMEEKEPYKNIERIKITVPNNVYI